MDQQLLIFALLGACAFAAVALLFRVRRLQREQEPPPAEDSPIAMSSEGVKLCPHCARENLWTDTQCIGCGRHLPDAQRAAW
jgi:hypothetical protein